MEAITKVLLHICTRIAALSDLTIKAVYRLINLYSYFFLLFFFFVFFCLFHINKSIALFFFRHSSHTDNIHSICTRK